MFGLFSRQGTVVPDQAESLARALRAAKVEHGDEVEVELTGVGVHGGTPDPVLSFCPASARLLRVLRRGSDAERRGEIPKKVKFGKAAAKTAVEHFTQKRGFAHLHARIITNGSIHIKNLDVTGFEPAMVDTPVNRVDSYQLYCQQR